MGRPRREAYSSMGPVEEIIEETVKLFLRNSIVFSGTTLADNVLQAMTPIGSGPGIVDGLNADNRRYSVRFLTSERAIKPFTRETMVKIEQCVGKTGYVEMEPSKNKEDKSRNSEFLIEWWAAKGMLSIEYVTSIELNL